MKTTVLAQALAAVLSIAAMPVSADTSNYSFNTYLSGNGPTTVSTFATLSIATTDYLTFTFDLKLGTNLSSVFGTGAFVSSMLVNTYANSGPLSSSILTGPWGVANVIQDTKNVNTGDILWDFTEKFCLLKEKGNSCNNPDNPGARLVAEEEVKWTTTFAAVQQPLLAIPGLALKVQGYSFNGKDSSAEYTAVSAVPEPESYAMLLAGLGLMGAIVWRRRQSDDS